LKNTERITEKNDTAFGIQNANGCVLLMRKITFAEKNAPESQCALHSIEDSIGMVTCGFKNQSTVLFDFVKNSAKEFRRKFHKRIPLKKLCENLSYFMNERSLRSLTSPFCVYVILCSWSEDNRAELFYMEPSGEFHGYFGCAVGKWKKEAKEEISKLNFQLLPSKELLEESLKVMLKVDTLDLEENKDIKSALTVVCIGRDTGGKIEYCTVKGMTKKEN
jgi:20S proteasome subunit alpha 7